MGKGFDTFMQNPYYKEQYNNAPSEELKRYFRLTWDRSPFVMGSDYDSTKEDVELRKMRLTKSDVEYLAKFAVGGPQKAACKKWLAAFDQNKMNGWRKTE